MMTHNRSPIGLLAVTPSRTPPSCGFRAFLVDTHFKNKRGFAMKIEIR